MFSQREELLKANYRIPQHSKRVHDIEVCNTSDNSEQNIYGESATFEEGDIDLQPKSSDNLLSEMGEVEEGNDSCTKAEAVTQKNAELLDTYLSAQSSMASSKTAAALTVTYEAPSTRKQLFTILKGKGLYKKFPTEKFHKFDKWLKSPSGGQLKCTEEIVSEINRYLQFSCPQKIKWRKLLDTKCFNNYLIVVKQAGLGPDGIKTKVERAITALKYLKHSHPSLDRKCQKAISEYREWLRPLVKKKKVLRMKNAWRNELCGLNISMEGIDEAVSPDTAKQFSKLMEKAMENQKLAPEEYRLIVDTLITLTITQESAIRPGAFQFMTLQELANPLTYISPTDDTVYNIVFVINHKTFASHGPIAVPFSETVWIQLHNYLKYVRPQVRPKAPHKQLVFLNAVGNMIKQPGKAVSKITKHWIRLFKGALCFLVWKKGMIL